MTPNDLEAYLVVLNRQGVGAAIVKLPGGAEFSVTFVPPLPAAIGSEPPPGGWKSPDHLDNPMLLREDDYKGDLP